MGSDFFVFAPDSLEFSHKCQISGISKYLTLTQLFEHLLLA